MTTGGIIGTGILVFVAGIVVGCQSSDQKEVGAATATPARDASETSAAVTPTTARLEESRPAEVLPAQFQAAIYEVQAGPDKLGTVNGEALTAQAATVERLLQALTKVGPTRILYRFDQPVNVYSETIRLGTSEPMVTGSRGTSSGGMFNTITYQQVGAIVRLSAQTPPKGARRKGPDVNLSVELSTLVPSDVEFAPGRKVTAIRSLSLQHSSTLDYGRPQVMLAVSSASADAQSPPAVYVVRYLFSPPASK